MCAGPDPPEFCSDKWCYVMPADCTLGSEQSRYTNKLVLSYETCGYFNRYEAWHQQRQINTASVVVAVLSNSGGWKGTVCSSPGVCGGPIYDLAKDILMQVKHREIILYDLRDGKTPSKFPAEVTAADPNESSAFEICTSAAAMGYVDLCVGSMSRTASRISRANYISLYSDAVHLVTTFTEEDGSWWKQILVCFAPFDYTLWLVLACTIFTIAIIITWHERVPKGELKSSTQLAAFKTTLFRSFAFPFRAAQIQAQTWGGKSASLALAVFSTFVMYFYLASLAANFVHMQPLSTGKVRSIDDVKGLGLKLCCQENLCNSLVSGGFITEKALIREQSRSDILPTLDAGKCAAAVIPHEDMQVYDSHGEFCHIKSVQALPIHRDAGSYVSKRFYKFYSQQVEQQNANGRWGAALLTQKPARLCKARLETKWTSKPTTVFMMSGPLFLTVFLLATGIVHRMLFGVKHAAQQVAEHEFGTEHKELHAKLDAVHDMLIRASKRPV